MTVPQMFFGKALKIDLSESKIEEIHPEDSLYRERIGGAGILSALLKDTEGDCIALGVGPLTGTPCPAGSAVVACSSSDDGVLRFAPILLSGGLEFKLSGFDFVTITGKSPEPSYLWIRDMMADIVRYPDSLSADCWETCSRIRKEQGDPRIQVISCSEGESASLNFTSGWDGIGFGSKMRCMNLKAIAFRGMADVGLHDPEAFLEKSSAMMKTSPSALAGKTGFSSLLGDSYQTVAGLKRARACFSCPFPCLSYAESGDSSHPQFLMLDQRTFLSYSGQGMSSEMILRQMSSEHRKGIARTGFINALDTITNGVAESEIVAVAYILGLCPRYMGLFNPGIEKYCELLGMGLGVEVGKERLVEIARSLLRS